MAIDLQELGLDDEDPMMLAAAQRLGRNREYSIGQALADAGVGIGATLAGQNGIQAVQGVQEKRLKALQSGDAISNRNLLALAKLRAAKEQQDQAILQKQKEFSLKEEGLKMKQDALDLKRDMQDLKAQQKDEKKIPAGEVVQQAAAKASLDQIADIEKTISENQNVFGPIAGTISGANPYDAKAQVIKAQVKTAAQKIGTFLEGGKLTDTDIQKYYQMLPQITDTPEVAADKLALVKRLVADRLKANIESLKGSGYATQGFQTPQVPNVPSSIQRGMVKVMSPDGRVGSIPAANLEKALKRGWKRAE